MSLELLAIVVGVALIGLGGVRLVCTTVSLNLTNFLCATQPNSLFRVGIAIRVTAASLTFLAGLLQRFLKLLNFLGELRKVMVYGITFLTAFLSGAEIGFLLSILLKSTTITSVVRGVHPPLASCTGRNAS